MSTVSTVSLLLPAGFQELTGPPPEPLAGLLVAVAPDAVLVVTVLSRPDGVSAEAVAARAAAGLAARGREVERLELPVGPAVAHVRPGPPPVLEVLVPVREAPVVVLLQLVAGDERGLQERAASAAQAALSLVAEPVGQRPEEEGQR